MTWLFGSSKKKLPPISDPVPLASQSDISPSNTKSLAALRQERIAAGIPIVLKSKAPGRLIGGFNRFVKAFQRLNQPPARPPQNIYKAKHGSHHRHRHHHKGGSHHRHHRKDGSGPEKKASKHHHHREHRWQREERLKREAEETARQGKHASSSSSPGLQAPKPVHVRRVNDPLPSMSPLSHQTRDLEGMLPSTHQGPGTHGRAVPEALNSSAGKGKQRAGEPAPCRLCSRRPEYRPGNGLCEECMRLAFEPGRGSTEVRRGAAVEDLRLPFASPTARKPQPAGEFDPSDPTSVHPSYRAESQAFAYVKGQDGRREREKSTSRNKDKDNDTGKGKYEPIAWRQKMGTEKAPEKKLPEYRTGTSLLDKFTFHNRNPPSPLTPDNLARHTSAPRPSAAPSIWTDVKCTDSDYAPAPRRRRSSALPDAHNPTITAATAAYNALHRFGAERNPAASSRGARTDHDDDSDADIGSVSHTGYTTIIDAYAREPTVTASRSTRNHPRSPPSPSVYPSTIAPRGRPDTTTGDIADAAALPLPLHFDDRDARRNFDPLHPAFFDAGANPWFAAGERIPSPAPEPVRKDSKYVADRGREEKPTPRSGRGDAGTGTGNGTGREKENGTGIGNGKERGTSQGHYTDRHGAVRHLPPAHPPIGPATTSKANADATSTKHTSRDARGAKPVAKAAGTPAPPAAYRGQDRGRDRRRERDAGGRVTELGEFTGGRTGEGRRRG